MFLTKAPCFKSCSQNARPKPTAAPVTTQNLSFSNIIKGFDCQQIKICNNLSQMFQERVCEKIIFSTLWRFMLLGNAFEEILLLGMR